MPIFRHIADIHRPRLTRGKITLLAIAGLSLTAALVMGVLALVPAVGKSPAAEALTLATTKQPERYTELYFLNTTSLPKSVKAGVAEGFAFRVINHENQAVTYRPRVTMIENGRTTTVLNAPTFTLQHGESRNVDIPFTVQGSGQGIEFNVELPEQNLGIHFRSRS